MSALWKLTTTSYTFLTTNYYLNVFGYLDNGAVPAAGTDLIDAFEAQVLPDIRGVISSDTVYTSITVENMTNGLDVFTKTLTPPQAGSRSGDRMPEFVSWGFELLRSIRGKRSGSKRFGAISESDVTIGQPTPTALTLLNTLATTLHAPITVGILDVWFPVILERKGVGIYPWTHHDFSGAIFKRVTSQNSRKT